MLPLAARVGEAQVDVFHVVVLDRFQDVFGGLHEYPFWLTGRRNLPRGAPVGHAPYNWGKLNTISECRKFGSDGIQPGFSCPDADRFLDVGHEDLAVANAPGLSRAPDGVDRFLDQIIGDHDLDFDLGQKIHDILRTAIELGMALLPPETLGFGHGDALQSDFLKRFFHLVELEWLDDGFYFFH